MFLSTWRNSIATNIGPILLKTNIVTNLTVGAPTPQLSNNLAASNSSSSGNSSLNSSGVSSITQTTTIIASDTGKKNEQVNLN